LLPRDNPYGIEIHRTKCDTFSANTKFRNFQTALLQRCREKVIEQSATYFSNDAGKKPAERYASFCQKTTAPKILQSIFPTMLKKISKMRTHNLLTHNVRHIAEVAALTHFPTSNRRKNSNFFQTTVQPQFWQYARCMKWLPSHSFSY
jgi:hypothetical protein